MKDPYFALVPYRTPREDPLPDLLERLNAATTQILITAYGFTLPAVVDALNAKHDAGLDVRAILDSSQFGGRTEQALVARIRFPYVTGRSDKGGIIHLKNGVFDAMWVWAGSWNWTSSATKEDNDVLLVRSRSFAADKIVDFESEWLRLKGAAPAALPMTTGTPAPAGPTSA